MTRGQLRPAAATAPTAHQFSVASCGEPVNFESLRRYTLGNPEVEREVLQLFCEHAPTMLARLRAADDEKSWHDAAHAMKGSALALGAWRIAELATQAEVPGDGIRRREELLTALEAAVDEVQDFIAAADWAR